MRPENILSVQAVQRLISDPTLPEDDGTIFYIELSDSASTAAWLSPMVHMEFAKEDRLGMVYGTEPGYVWISSQAIRTLQEFVSHENIHILNCASLIRALDSLGYDVKQVGSRQTPRGLSPSEEIEYDEVKDKFVKTAIKPLMVGLVCFIICALISSQFSNWFAGVENWLVGGSWGALIGSWITKRILSKHKK